MTSARRLIVAFVASMAVLLGLSGPALAAGTWGGAGTPFSISSYNTVRTGYLPSPDSSVPSTSTITGISYNFDWTSSGFTSGNMSIQLCVSGGSNCITASRFQNTTSAFNGLPATTQFVFKAYFFKTGVSGTISGGPINVTDSISVGYN
jgi:hypothetical protein